MTSAIDIPRGCTVLNACNCKEAVYSRPLHLPWRPEGRRKAVGLGLCYHGNRSRCGITAVAAFRGPLPGSSPPSPPPAFSTSRPSLSAPGVQRKLQAHGANLITRRRTKPPGRRGGGGHGRPRMQADWPRRGGPAGVSARPGSQSYIRDKVFIY